MHVAAIVHVVVFSTRCLLIDVCAHISLWLVDFYWWLEHPLILQPCNEHWNSVSMNWPPLSWIHRAGHSVVQTCPYLLAKCADILVLLIQTSSTKLDVVSIIIRALTL